MARAKNTFIKRALSIMLTLVMAIVLLPAVPKLNANAVTKYNLWVLDKQVTSANYNNILGNGSARYDISTKTLYFTKGVVDYENNKDFDFNYPFVKSYISGLTISTSDFIHADGAVTFVYGSQIYGLELYADTTLTGSGRFFIDGHHTINVYGNSTLTIKDTEVSINNLNRYFNNAMGICGNEDNTKLRIENSKVWVSSNPDKNYYTTAAICGFKRGIELVDIYDASKYIIKYVSNSNLYDGYAVLKNDGSWATYVDFAPVKKMTATEIKNEIGQIIDDYTSGKITKDSAIDKIIKIQTDIKNGNIKILPTRRMIVGTPIKVDREKTISELNSAGIISASVDISDLVGTIGTLEVVHRPSDSMRLSDRTIISINLSLYESGEITRTQAINNIYNIISE